MCNNCNVGKRRTCEGCALDCETCSWAYPETYGVRTMVSISEKTLRRVDAYSLKTSIPRDKVMGEASGYYLDALEED